MPRLGREGGTGRLPCTGYSAEPEGGMILEERGWGRMFQVENGI